MRTSLVSSLSVLAATIALAGASHAGVRWELEHGSGDTLRTTSFAIEGKKLRVERPIGKTGAARVILYDATTGRVVMLDTGRAAYYEIVASTADQAKTPPPTPQEQMEKFLTPEMKARLQNATPEERAMIEQAMRPQGGSQGTVPPVTGPRQKLTFERSGTRRTMNGRQCEPTRGLIGGRPVEDDCILPWGTQSLTRDEVILVGQLSLRLDPTGRADPAKQPVPDYSKAPGFPIVHTVLGPDGTPALTQNVTKLERVKVPATAFEIPPNYTKDTSPISMVRDQ